MLMILFFVLPMNWMLSKEFANLMSLEFEMSMMGELNFFIGLQIFFLFEDFEIISSFIQSTPGMLLNPGSTSYPILVKIFYSNLSFIMIDGNPALRSFVKG